MPRKSKKTAKWNELSPGELDEIVMDFVPEVEEEDAILDRRQSPRLDVFGQVVCLPLGGTREVRGELIDFSQGGLYFLSPRRLKQTDIVQVSFTVDGLSDPTETIAQVIRVTPGGGGFEIALKFLSEE